MKLKAITSCLIIMGLIFTTGITFASSKKEPLPSSFLFQAMNKYKQKNYTGCIQDMDYMIQKGHPTDLAFYYKAISYSKLGMSDMAKENYQQAINVTSNTTLKDYASQALICIDDPSACDMNLDDGDITKFIKSEKFMHNDVKNNLQENAINRAKEEINNQKKPSDANLKYINQNNNQPTDKEIADAIRTLSKLGINPFNSMSAINPYMQEQNAELMQINALLGNNNNSNNMMNLIPILTMQGGNTQASKDLMQAYMMNQMLPNFNFGNNDK